MFPRGFAFLGMSARYVQKSAYFFEQQRFFAPTALQQLSRKQVWPSISCAMGFGLALCLASNSEISQTLEMVVKKGAVNERFLHETSRLQKKEVDPPVHAAGCPVRNQDTGMIGVVRRVALTTDHLTSAVLGPAMYYVQHNDGDFSVTHNIAELKDIKGCEDQFGQCIGMPVVQCASAAAMDRIPVRRYEMRPFVYMMGGKLPKPTKHEITHYLPWPSPEQVAAKSQGFGNHLLLGMSHAAMLDFLEASGWPSCYTRSAEHIRRNGPLIRGEEIGYDVTAHIEAFMRRKGYEQFSVAEVMYAAGYPNMGKAQAFLSHAQSEFFRVTLDLHFRALVVTGGGQELDQKGLLTAIFDDSSICHVPIWLDYFCLRQCVDDFVPERIANLIQTIGSTVAGTSESRDGSSPAEMLTRTWCNFEIVCSLVGGARFWAISSPDPCVLGTWVPTPEILSRAATQVNLVETKVSNPDEREDLLDYLSKLPGGLERANETVQAEMIILRKRQYMEIFQLALFRALGFGVSLRLVMSSPLIWLCISGGLFCQMANRMLNAQFSRYYDPLTLGVEIVEILVVPFAWLFSYLKYWQMYPFSVGIQLALEVSSLDLSDEALSEAGGRYW